jgi:hypothetical protein
VCILLFLKLANVELDSLIFKNLLSLRKLKTFLFGALASLVLNSSPALAVPSPY